MEDIHFHIVYLKFKKIEILLLFIHGHGEIVKLVYFNGHLHTTKNCLIIVHLIVHPMLIKRRYILTDLIIKHENC